MLREMESSRKLLRLADRSLGGPRCLSGSCSWVQVTFDMLGSNVMRL